MSNIITPKLLSKTLTLTGFVILLFGIVSLVLNLASKQVVTDINMIILGGVLFGLGWLWMREIEKYERMMRNIKAR